MRRGDYMQIEDIQADMIAVIIKTVKIFLLTYYCNFGSIINVGVV